MDFLTVEFINIQMYLLKGLSNNLLYSLSNSLKNKNLGIFKVRTVVNNFHCILIMDAKFFDLSLKLKSPSKTWKKSSRIGIQRELRKPLSKWY